MSNNNLVDDKFGYVEDVAEEGDYQNIDYRDTTVPLWNKLYKNKKTGYNRYGIPIDECQSDINLALCASIIQLGKNMQQTNANIFEKLEKLEKKISNISLVLSNSS